MRALTAVVPEALFWALLVPVLDAYDWLYLHWWHPVPVGPVLCVDRRIHRGPARRFPDGTVLRPGDPVGELHLRNRCVLAIHRRARHPIAVGLAFRRLLVTSLRGLAARVGTEPRLGALRVFHARTILVTGAERLGFAVSDGDTPAPFLRILFFHLLLCRYHGAGLARLPETALPTRDLWLTAGELHQRYGAAAAPPAPAVRPERA